MCLLTLSPPNVPVVAADLLSPAGEVDGGVWFPSLSAPAVTTLLEGYLVDAYNRTADDTAAALWSYYRAATAVADRLSAAPASSTLDLTNQGKKTVATLGSQVEWWQQKAAAYLAAYLAAIAEVVDDPLQGFRVLTSLRHA